MSFRRGAGRVDPDTEYLASSELDYRGHPDVMSLSQIALLSATFLCSLVAGLLFAFAVVVMPGLRSLDDRGFIRAFQAIDRVIQNNQPLFLLVWVGSAFSLLAAAGLGLWAFRSTDQLLSIVAMLVYLLGVQLPTITVNIPLNNALQKLDVGQLSDSAAQQARAGFESRWNRSNVFRTICASVTSILLLLLLLTM